MTFESPTALNGDFNVAPSLLAPRCKVSIFHNFPHYRLENKPNTALFLASGGISSRTPHQPGRVAEARLHRLHPMFSQLISEAVSCPLPNVVCRGYSTQHTVAWFHIAFQGTHFIEMANSDSCSSMNRNILLRVNEGEAKNNNFLTFLVYVC